jgi:hypothetical protein
VGGPAIKNKLFWFTDYQGTRQSQGSSSTLSVLPSVAQRNGVFDPGDLSGSVNGPYWAQLLSGRLGYTVRNNEPYSAPDCASTADCVFPNGVIPARAVSPISSNLLGKYVPLPNVGVNQYLTASQVSTIRDDKAGQRVDFNTPGSATGMATITTTTPPSSLPPALGRLLATSARKQTAACSNSSFRIPKASAPRQLTKRVSTTRVTPASRASLRIPRCRFRV